ncbi:DNA topoisomerase 4 subunit A [compost metagenome]
MVMAAIIPQGQYVTLFAGKRKLTLKPSDLDYYRGERGRRGAKLPRGLQRVDRIEIEPAAGAEPVAGENQEG